MLISDDPTIVIVNLLENGYILFDISGFPKIGVPQYRWFIGKTQ